MKKASIIGSGNVGANSAFFIAENRSASVTLVDVKEGLPEGKALDLSEAGPIRRYDTAVRGASSIEDIRDSEIVVIAAGRVRSPNETREDALLTLEFVKDCGVKIRGNSNAQQMQLYFGAELYSTHRERGIKPLRESFPPYLAIGSAFETDWMSEAEIKQVERAWRAESLDGGKRMVS